MDTKNTITSKEVKKILNENFKQYINIFYIIIPRSTKVLEANIYKQTICEYIPENVVSKSYGQLVQEMMKIE